jgi:hypothetical protein
MKVNHSAELFKVVIYLWTAIFNDLTWLEQPFLF